MRQLAIMYEMLRVLLMSETLCVLLIIFMAWLVWNNYKNRRPKP